jgi:hypothetical protein
MTVAADVTFVEWLDVARVIEAGTRFHDDCGHRGWYGEDVDHCDDVCRAIGAVHPRVIERALRTVRGC